MKNKFAEITGNIDHRKELKIIARFYNREHYTRNEKEVIN